jgi:hypothetical protein
MVDRIHRGTWVLWILLLLCAVCCAQTASLFEIHSHEHSPQHCCGLCHTGPLPFVAPAGGAENTPLLAVVALAIWAEGRCASEQSSSHIPTRGPPLPAHFS